MKKSFLFLLLMVISVANAQVQRFYYNYKFQTDSTNNDSKKEELMTLDIDKKGSRYYSEYVYLNDSVMDADFKKQSMMKENEITVNVSSGKQGVVRSKVLKAYPDYTITYLLNVNMQDYQVNETRKIKWKILPEKEKIGEWNTQKATTEFAGRKWTAWFSEELPFQDGPYKFSGLPGLIVKMEDASKTQSFELNGVKKNVSARDFENIGYAQQAIKIDDKKLKSIYKAYWEDPVSGMRKMYTEGNVEIRD